MSCGRGRPPALGASGLVGRSAASLAALETKSSRNCDKRWRIIRSATVSLILFEVVVLV